MIDYGFRSEVAEELAELFRVAIAIKGGVARTGFEPVISGLKGRRPGPLDERAAPDTKLLPTRCGRKPMVGGEGFEPPTSSMSSWRSPS